ncbi:MAG: type II toxin-antitoxin system VapC family toxin [Spirochaetaceae bacterium]|jgi:PIN domain nuclease of toxin-antitoxin system|nr:type II toxin-antitoxin system VapC family toxin [Spirochaetaceae bacterium]
MNYLVDTHILLWSFLKTHKLSKEIKSILLNKDNDIYYSPMNLWEISIKYGLKKLFLNGGTPDEFFGELNNSYYLCKDINNIDLITNYKLPMYHRDPFDRFLLWEAMRNNFILMSVDKNMELYKKDGLKVIY